MKKTLLAIFLSLFSIQSYSQQKMIISGNVVDSTGINPISEAIVMAVRLKDSSLLGFTRTNENGFFDLKNIPLDTFNLIVTHFKFEDKSFFVFGNESNYVIDIPKVRMNVKSMELEEVVIYTNRNPIYFRGDTMVYVADSFKVGQNAVVEDLLKKLPGIQVDKDGKIKSQGKEITKVLVDGDEFFGSDPTIATKNLSAKNIETVEVFEKKNESSTDGDETVQVMNLKLKEDAKNGYFGRTSAATDFNKFYEGEFFMNKFNGPQKISIFSTLSNTPKSSLDWGDIYKFGLDNEASGGMNEDGDYVQYYNNNQGNGVPKTMKSGIYYKDKIGKKKKTNLGFNYTYTNYQVTSKSSSKTQYFLADTNYFSEDNSISYSKNESHKMNLNIESKIDSLTTLTIKPSLNISLGKSTSADYSTYLSRDTIKTRENDIFNENSSKGNEFKNELSLLRKFKKDRRSILFEYFTTISSNNNSGKLNYSNLYYNSINQNDTTDQSKINKNSQTEQIGKIRYTEPLSKKIKLELEYNVELGSTKQTKESRDFKNGSYSLLNTGLSNNFENTKLQNRIATTFIYESKKHILRAGGKVRNIQIHNINLVTNKTIDQNINSFLPKINYTFKPSQSKRLFVKYSTSSTQPSISSLQPIFDNTNPNRVPIGNPNLKPNYQHTIGTNYNSWNSLDGRYVWMGANLNITNKDFGDSTTYDENNRQYSKTVNINGNYSGYFYLGSSFSFWKKKFEINPNFNVSQNKNSNYINGVLNKTITSSASPSLSLSLNLDSLNISIGSSVEYSSPHSSISSVSNKPYSTHDFYCNVQWTLPWWHLSINTDATYTVNSKRANGYDIKYFIWNANINKAFLKKENLILSFQGNDILNQNILAQRNVSANSITDYKTKIISRYFLVKLTFKFNSDKNSEEDEW